MKTYTNEVAVESVLPADASLPPGVDPSSLRELRTGDLPEDLSSANEGAFVGGITRAAADASERNVITAMKQ